MAADVLAERGHAPPDWEGALDDEVTISALEHYSYCPRQCALIHVERIYRDNVYTVRGELAHQRVHSGLETVDEGVRVLRGIPLWSTRLGLRGQADVVELRPTGPYPVEYKFGGRQSLHAEVQLCAQALCLEEMLGVAVERGALYLHRTRRRREVAIDAALRERTVAIVAAVRSLLVREELPPPVNDARCRDCSLADECMPEVLASPGRLRALQAALYRPDAWPAGGPEEE